MLFSEKCKRVQDSTGREYILYNGTCYHVDTNEDVIQWLDYFIHNRVRVHLHYGDTDTGRDWNEEHDIEGYIGRSTGQFKIPLMIHSERSYGGPALLEHCILKISAASGEWVYYQHPLFQESTYEIVPSDMPEYECNMLINGELYSRHTTKSKANWLKRFMSK